MYVAMKIFFDLVVKVVGFHNFRPVGQLGGILSS